MSTPLVTWSCIVGLFAVVGLVKLLHGLTACKDGKHHLIESGSEREIFFIPGDPNPKMADETDEYDAEWYDGI